MNKRVARRLSRFGTRWIPWGPAIVNLEESIPAMKQAIADVGGDPTDLEVQGTAALKKDADGGIDVDASVAPVAEAGRCWSHRHPLRRNTLYRFAASDRTVFAAGDRLPRCDRLGPDFCVRAVDREESQPSCRNRGCSMSAGRARSGC